MYRHMSPEVCKDVCKHMRIDMRIDMRGKASWVSADIRAHMCAGYVHVHVAAGQLSGHTL